MRGGTLVVIAFLFSGSISRQKINFPDDFNFPPSLITPYKLYKLTDKDKAAGFAENPRLTKSDTLFAKLEDNTTDKTEFFKTNYSYLQIFQIKNELEALSISVYNLSDEKDMQKVVERFGAADALYKAGWVSLLSVQNYFIIIELVITLDPDNKSAYHTARKRIAKYYREKIGAKLLKLIPDN